MKSLSTPLNLTLFALLASLSQRTAAYTWPSPQYDALEKLLYEGTRLDGLSLSDLASNCKTRPRPNGGVVAAEWLRFAFHDFAAYDAATQTGGLDASVFYELDRPENVGVSMTSSAADYLQFTGKYVSRADLVALGTVLGTASCGGLNIPFRGGRPEATEGGSRGVPSPDQTVDAYTVRFRTAGMNSSEMVTMIACGHTIGGVRKNEVPSLFSKSGPRDVYQSFDSTARKFDLTVASEYLSKRTSNPLVTAPDVTLRSDARIFGSDGGATLRSLISSKSKGLEACRDTLGKMIHSVPRDATLTETITVLPAKVVEPRLTVENGQLIFQVDLRLTQPVGTKPPTNRVVTLAWCDARGAQADCSANKMNTAPVAATSTPSSSPVALQDGVSFKQYAFRVPISSAKSVGKFWFVVKDGEGAGKTKTYANDGKFYKLQQDSVIFAPRLAADTASLSSLGSFNWFGAYTHKHGVPAQFSKSQNVVVGIRSELSPSSVVAESTELATANTNRPTVKSTALTASKMKQVDGYKFYTGTVKVSKTSGLTFDIKAVVNRVTFTEEYLSPKTAAYIRPTKSSIVTASIPA